MKNIAADQVDKPAYPIGSVDSALRLLLLIRDRGPIRIAEASRELGIARSTAHRLLQMLQYHGFIQQDTQSKLYGAGRVWIDMGLRVVRDLDVRAIARPHIERLVDEIKETVHLLEYQNTANLACLDSIESPRALRVGGRTGMTLPAFASAAGRAVFAHMDDAEVRSLYPNARLPKHLPNTITKRSDLFAEIAKVRQLGYAVQHEETEPGVSGVAAAVADHRGRARLAITAAIPSTRLSDSDVPEIGDAVVRCSKAIAEGLPW